MAIFSETERKRRRIEIIQAQPNTDKKIVLMRSKRNELPYEIVQEILSNLSTKAAVRFSCVSKLWFRAVSDVYFRDLHYSRMGADLKPGIVLLRYNKNKDDNIISIYLPSLGRAGIRLESDIPSYHLSTRQNYEFCNACNGLLCFVSRNPTDPIIVSNPLTDEHLTLPSAPPPFRKCNHFVALGFCPSSERYKLFRLSFCQVRVGRWSVAVGALEVHDIVGRSEPWRMVSKNLNMTPSGRPLYLDGRIHWVVISKPICKGSWNESMIFSVDVCSEKYTYITIPHAGVAFRRYREATILALEGCLSVAALYYGDVRIYFWVLKDFKRGRWDLQYTCEHLPFPIRDVSIRAGEIVGLFSYGGIIYIRFHHRWVCYDTSKDSSKSLLTPLHYHLDESELPIIPDHGDVLGGFYPSLLSPKQLASCFRQCDIGHQR